MQSTLKKFFAICAMLPIFPTSSNCLTKPEILKLREIEEFCLTFLKENTTVLFQQIQETKEGDFICFQSTEKLLRAHQAMVFKLIDSLPLFFLNKSLAMNNIFNQINKFYIDWLGQNLNEKEAKKLAMFYAINNLTEKISEIIKFTDVEIRGYLQYKAEVEKNTKIGIPVFLIGLISLLAMCRIPEAGCPKFITHYIVKPALIPGSIFFIVAPPAIISVNYLQYFVFKKCYEYQIEKLRDSYSKIVIDGLLNPQLCPTEYKKTAGKEYVSDKVMTEVLTYNEAVAESNV